MAIFKCKMCGGDLEVVEGQNVATCPYCGSTQTICSSDDEKKINLFNRANNLRLKCEFDKALVAYQSIVADFDDDAEAYWGLCLCKYGIEYVDDPRTGDKVPTCHRTLFESILDDSDYLEALNLSDVIARDVYISEAKEIDRLQKHIIKISQKEDPYDIFICYKETDDKGQRTEDSVLAHDVYEKLTEKGYKVFFSRISLENKLGQEYEPIIFAALRSAKIMICVGTNEDYFNAVWVKNEWSRFLSFMKDDKDKYLIPCYKGISPYDMPEEFTSLQSQDMGKLGYIQDLVRGIDKIFGNSGESRTNSKTKMSIDEILEKLEKSIGDYDFKKAEWLIEEALSIKSACAEAYFFKILVERNLNSKESLKESTESILDNFNYQRALEYASATFKKEITEIANSIETNIKNGIYDDAKDYFDRKNYSQAKELFEKIPDYKDSKELIEKCDTQVFEDIYESGIQAMNSNYFERAKEYFDKIPDYKDSKEKSVICGNEDLIANETRKINIAIKTASKSAFNSSIEKLETILDYSNVAEQIEDFKARFNAQLDKNAKKHHKKKIIIISLSSVAVALTAFFVLLGTLIIPSSKYNDAMSLLGQGKYDEAQEILENLNFKDSKKKSEFITVEKSLQRSDFNSAIKQTCDYGGIVNLKYSCSKGTLSKTSETITKYEDFVLPTWNCDGYHIEEWSVTSHFVDFNSYNVDINLGFTSAITQYKVELCKDSLSKVDETISYNIEKAVTIDNVSKTGYEFLGWTGTDLSTATKDLVLPIGTFGDKKYLANWKAISYTISYHLDGGSTTNPESYTIEDVITLKDATKTGYIFLGWFTSDSFTTSITKIQNSTGNLDLYAKWSANTYKLTLDANGGNLDNPKTTIDVTYNDNFSDGSSQVIKYGRGQTIKCVAPVKSRAGYVFSGKWYKNSACTNEFNFNGEEVPNDLTLYAGWTSCTSGSYHYVTSHGSNHRFTIYQGTVKKENEVLNIKADLDFSATLEVWINPLTVSCGSCGSSKTVTLSKGTYSQIKIEDDYWGTYSYLPGDTYEVVVSYRCSLNYTNETIDFSYYISYPPVMQSSTAICTLPQYVSSTKVDVTYNSLYSLPVPIRDGYSFNGWKCGGVSIPSAGTNWNYLSSDSTLVAEWIKE